MIKFEKVSYEEFKKAFQSLGAGVDEEAIKEVYDNVQLPKRSTEGSAGYDFFNPYGMMSIANEAAMINTPLLPTGIRFVTDQQVVLLCYPRSGQGVNHGMRLMNTVGVIDSDYWISDNEGHIMFKASAVTPITIERGKAFMQAIITPYLKTDDDNTTEKRNGGFGSTSK